MGYKLNLASGGLLGINNITIQEVTANTTLTADRIVVFRNTIPITATLPAQADAEIGQVIRIKALTTGDASDLVTISPDGTDTIDGVTQTIEIDDPLLRFDLIYEGFGNWLIF